METTSSKFFSVIGQHLRRTFLGGLLILVPVVLTYMVLNFVFNAIDGVLRPIFTPVGASFPGVGILALIILVYLSGLLGVFYIGRKLIDSGQWLLLKTPIVRVVYSSAKQLIESLSSGSADKGFKRVVMIEHPRKGAWTVGFLTGIATNENNEEMAIVYIPTAPTPTSGLVSIVPFKDVYDTDISISDAMALVFSGGITSPSSIKKTKAVKEPENTQVETCTSCNHNNKITANFCENCGQPARLGSITSGKDITK